MVPLDQIWTLDMPGTRDIRDLEPDKFGSQVRELDTEEQVRLFDHVLVQREADYGRLIADSYRRLLKASESWEKPRTWNY